MNFCKQHDHHFIGKGRNSVVHARPNTQPLDPSDESAANLLTPALADGQLVYAAIKVHYALRSAAE